MIYRLEISLRSSQGNPAEQSEVDKYNLNKSIIQ